MTRKRSLINDGTVSIGMGPLDFDVEMARRHGWLDTEIESAYEQVTAIVKRFGTTIETRRPDLYAIGSDGSILFVGNEVSDGWFRYERRAIEISLGADPAAASRYAVHAYVVGNFAAHKGVGPQSAEWVVTHIPTGATLASDAKFGIGNDFDEYEARRLACHLDRVLGEIAHFTLASWRSGPDEDLMWIIQSVAAQVLAYEDLTPDDHSPDKQGFIA